MRHGLAAVILSAVLSGALAGGADAASLGVLPVKGCYRSGEALFIGGDGYTPNGQVQITSGATPIGTRSVDGNGAFTGQLTVAETKGERTKTYVARDVPDPALSAFLQLRVSAFAVDVAPRTVRPGQPLRVRARGFTTGETLYAHVLRGRHRRRVRLGVLKGPCGNLSVRKRIFTRSARSARYAVQYDTSHTYSRRTAVKLIERYRVVPPRR